MDTAVKDPSETVLVRVPLQVLGLSTAYAASLSWLERRFPGIKPDHVWAEVAGGVLISLIPVALEARRLHQQEAYMEDPAINWQMYETTIWCSFIASGAPIILWQIGESVLRHMELLRYTASRDGRSLENDADHTTTVASGSGERTGTGIARGNGSDLLPAGGPEEN